MIGPLGAFALGAALAFAGAALIVRAAGRGEIAGIAPAADRWHRRAVPGLGGVAMFVPFALVAALETAGGSVATGALLTGAALMFAVGLVDDLRGLGPGAKLGAQVLAALLVVSPALAGHGTAGPGAALAGALWIVVVMNGTNLLDNMDGLAAGVALAAVAAALALAFAGETLPAADAPLHVPPATLAALCGALAGFLALNAPPARLFMGDAGSQWIGLAVGAAGVAAMEEARAPFAGSGLLWLVPALLSAVALADTATVIVTRRRRGHPVWRGGRDHLSHRLVRAGRSERAAVATLWAWAVAGAALGVGVARLPVPPWASALAAAAFALGLGAFARRLARVPPDDPAPGPVAAEAPAHVGTSS